MREPLKDRLRLTHIKEACDRLIHFFPGGSIPVLDGRSMDYFGLIKNLEIIGEAAYMLSLDFKSTHSETDWRSIVAMRHLMVHGYYNISPKIVREILESEIVKLRNQVVCYLENC